LSYVIAGAVATVVVSVVVPVIATARRTTHGQTCASNLQRIGQAMQQYLSDYDQTFPPAYCATYEDAGNHYAAWDSLLDPYIGSGVAPESGWAYVDSWNATFVPETQNTKNKENKVPPDTVVRAPWHCPEDMADGVLSYGLNPMVSGAYKIFHNRGVDEKVVHAQEWQDSLRLSQVPDPASIVWAGDTNRLWDSKKKQYTAQVFPEWPRRTDLYLRQMTEAELRRWYRSFLSRDLTDYRDDCPYPLAWGCRAPAYRHSGTGSGTGSGGSKKIATMLFCDGHVRSFPAGTLQVENVFPDRGKSSSGTPEPAVSTPVPEYTLTPIQSKDVTSGMHAGGLNNRGDVAGGNYWDMIVWKDGVGRDLHWNPPSQGSGTSWGINDSGVIVSDVKLYVNGQFRLLGQMPGYSGVAARAINNRGQLVGRVFNDGASPTAGSSHAFLWQDGRFRDLGVPPGCVSTTAYAINDRGEVVGSAVTKDNRTHAFLWSKGVMRDLGTLPGGTLSIAYGINNKGQIVGDSDSGEGKGLIFHPVLWENGQPRDLGMPAGYRYCIAKAINDRGQVVCMTTDLDHVPLSPMLWDAQNGMRRLDTLCPFDSGWLLREAYGINARGQILCWGFHHTDMSLVLLTPK